MATKLELECKLLMVEHEIRHHSGNMNTFNFRASLCTSNAAKAENTVSAAYCENRKAKAETKADHLRNLIADAT